MKKSIMTLAIALLMGSSMASAQDNQDRPQRPRMDRQELTQRRTDMMVKQYGLNDEQAKKLLELNTEFAKKMGPGAMGRRPAGGPRPRWNQNGAMPNMDMNGMDPQAMPDFSRQNGPNPERLKRMAQREENRKAYEAELKKILTEEQFSKYKADEANRRQMRPRRGGRQPMEKND